MVEIENVVARGLKKMRQIIGGQAGIQDKPLSPRQIVRLRKMETHDRQEMEAILDTYKAALGL